MAEKLIHLPIEEARKAKWRRGREQYGPVFIGQPLEELDEELLDAMNYAEEAALDFSLPSTARCRQPRVSLFWSSICTVQCSRTQELKGREAAEMRRWIIVLPLALCASCQREATKSAVGLRPAPSPENLPKASSSESLAQGIGRYTLLQTGTRTLRMDTVTGYTWVLDKRHG